jgi:hypothetical protein
MGLSETIEDAIEQIDVEGIVKEYVRERVAVVVSESIKKEIQNTTQLLIERIIISEAETILTGEIKTDDGWGHKREWPSFRDMFKQRFAEKLNGSFEIKKIIESSVQKKMDVLFREEAGRISQALIKVLTENK